MCIPLYMTHTNSVTITPPDQDVLHCRCPYLPLLH